MSVHEAVGCGEDGGVDCGGEGVEFVVGDGGLDGRAKGAGGGGNGWAGEFAAGEEGGEGWTSVAGWVAGSGGGRGV